MRKPKVFDKWIWDEERKRLYLIEKMEMPRMRWYRRLWIRLVACYLILFARRPTVSWINLRDPYWKNSAGWKATHSEINIFWKRIKRNEK